jgi:PAS domain S-box-containing protein
MISPAGVVERLGAGVCEMLGLTEPFAPGASLEALFFRTERGGYARLQAALEQIRNGAAHSGCGQLSLANAEGGNRHADWSVYALDDGTDARAAVLILKIAETGIGVLGSLESYRETFEHAVEGIFRTTLEGSYLEVNPALARIYGYQSPKDLMGQLQNLNRQLYVKAGRRREFVRLMQQQGFVSNFESEVYRADGTTVWIAEYARTACDSQGKALFFEGSVVDITEHKRVEKALKESRERFRRLVESMNLVPWEADLETERVTYVGPQAEEFLGFPMRKWLKEDFWKERIHPEDRAWMIVSRAEALEKRGRFESEYRMVTHDGRTVWVRDIVSIIKGRDGREVLAGFLLDITHRRAAEELLRENRQFTEQVAAASPVIWYVYDLAINDVVYVNGAGVEALGFTKNALQQMEPVFLLALAHPSEEEAWWKHVTSLVDLKPGVIVEREFRLRAAQGDWVWLRTGETSFRQDAAGRTTQIVGTAENITMHRMAMEQLERNEALFRKLAETTRVIPFEVDLRARRFAYVGPQAEPLLGFPLSHWYRAGFWSAVIHPDDEIVAERLCREALESRETDIDAEFRMRTESGEYKWMRQIVRGGSMEEKAGLGRGFLIDVTSAKLMEAEREQTRAQLRELAVQGQKQLEEERMRVAREIHDELGQAMTLLRIDLAWLGGRVGRTVSGDALPPLMDKLEAMEQRLEETLQAARRITTKLRPPVLDEFGLAEAIEWQANDFTRRAGIRCQVIADFQGCPDKDAETVVFRIFQEILTNVARHSKASRVEVRLEQTPDSLWLSVRDNGCGFKAGEAKKQAGFGLLGMRERAEGAGGRLVIVSTPDEGTTISVTLPIQFQPR